jgi:hypothetical protein
MADSASTDKVMYMMFFFMIDVWFG